MAVALATIVGMLGIGAPAGGTEHVVRPGEWLWSIARDDLRAQGSAAPTDHEVRLRADAIYTRNRDLIGPDPNRLAVGLRLELDGGTGRNGVPGTYADARGLALDAEGRAVTAGQLSRGFGLFRFLVDGSPDRSFDGDGIVATAIGDHASAAAVAVQPDGRIVAAGRSNGQTGAVRADVTLARYLPDGRLDPTFGRLGVVTTSVRDYAAALAVVVQPDGRIVVAGSASDDTSGLATDILVVRYLADGTLDPSFGTGGIVETDVAGSIDIASGLALTDDGRLVVGGTSDRNVGPADTDLLAARYLADGALDPSFGGDGIVTVDAGSAFDQGTAVWVDPGGAVLVAGDAVPGGVDPHAVVARLDGSGGPVAIVRTHALTEAHALTVDGAGRLVLAGRAGAQGAIVRMHDDGTLDRTFAGFEAERSAAFAVTIAGDGRVVAAGCTCDGSNTTYRGGFEIPTSVIVVRADP